MAVTAEVAAATFELAILKGASSLLYVGNEVVKL